MEKELREKKLGRTKIRFEHRLLSGGGKLVDEEGWGGMNGVSELTAWNAKEKMSGSCKVGPRKGMDFE